MPRSETKIKQFIGIPLLIIFIAVLGNRLVDSLYDKGGIPVIIIAVLIILMLLMLVVKQLFD